MSEARARRGSVIMRNSSVAMHEKKASTIVHLSDGMDKIKIEEAIANTLFKGSNEMVIFPGSICSFVPCLVFFLMAHCFCFLQA